MERGRSSSRDGRASGSGTASQYCIETTAYQAGAEINIVMVLRTIPPIYVWSESFPAASQLVRNAAAHHPPDRDLAQRSIVDRAADAAGGRDPTCRSTCTLTAGCADRISCRNSIRKLAAGGAIFRDAIRDNPARPATAASCR
jgi:hypothetical protein